jgi:hypothetical protein
MASAAIWPPAPGLLEEYMAVTLARKVYDFKIEAVKEKLVVTFRSRRNEATIADLVTVTGLPTYQVQQTARVVLDEYGGHCKVTESGEILYSFPNGMHSRVSGFFPGLKRFGRAFLRGLGKVLTLLFKIWIMVMLVGYFILFLAIVLAAIVASVGLSFSSRTRRRGRGGFGAFYIVVRLLEAFLRMFFWVSLTKSDKPEKKPGRAFYKSVFGFVFGDLDPNVDWEGREKIRILSFIRSQKGVITIAELMALTGRDWALANRIINSYLVEFEGEPSVTEDGSLYFFFPELLRTKKEELLLSDVVTVDETEYRRLVPFAENKGGTNGIIGFFNSFNLLFGSYFAWYGASALAGLVAAGGFGSLYAFLHTDVLGTYAGIADPALGLFIGLGLIPLVFSVLFFIVPVIRNLRRRALNETIKRENLKKKLFAALHFAPIGFDPASVTPAGEADRPVKAAELLRRETERLAAETKSEVEEAGNGTFIYNFEELKRQIADIAALRKSIDLNKYDVGETVFDTNK